MHPREIHLPKFTLQNATQNSGQKIHIAPLQGHLAELFSETLEFKLIKGRTKNNELNFLWPKTARLGPPFRPNKPPPKSLCGSLFVAFPSK